MDARQRRNFERERMKFWEIQYLQFQLAHGDAAAEIRRRWLEAYRHFGARPHSYGMMASRDICENILIKTGYKVPNWKGKPSPFYAASTVVTKFMAAHTRLQRGAERERHNAQAGADGSREAGCD